MRTDMEKGGDGGSVSVARGGVAFVRNHGLCSIFLASWGLRLSFLLELSCTNGILCIHS